MSESESNIPQEQNQDNGNWVKEHRSIIDHRIWRCPYLYQLWRFLIMEAKWADDVYSDGEVKIPLKRGELVCSISHILKHINATRGSTGFRLKTLQRLDTIQTEIRQGLTVITICNYDKYQCSENKHSTEIRHDLDGISTEIRQNLGTSKELKTKRTKELRIKELNNKEVSPEPSAGAPVWDAYASEFEKRFQRKPLRNVAVNSMCKKIAEMVGKEDALKLVKFYVNHPKQFYASKGYDLRFLVGDLQALHGEMLSGKPVAQAYEAPKRPIDIGPAYSYKERVVEDCANCGNKGLLEKLDERGVAYRCHCYWFIKNGYKRADYQADPQWIAENYT